jgi:hypothetical protein
LDWRKNRTSANGHGVRLHKAPKEKSRKQSCKSGGRNRYLCGLAQ